MSYNPESGWGKFLLGAIAAVGPTVGRIFVVCPSSDANYDQLSNIVKYDPEGQARLFTDLAEAYAAMTSNRNDVLFMSANASHTLATALAVSKNRCHFIGMDLGGHLTGSRTRVSLASASLAVDTPATIVNTGVGNSFRNLKVMNSGTHANSISSFIDAGEATVIENCQFMKFSDLNETGVSDFYCAADSYTYKDCEFGYDTLVQSVARPTFRIKKYGTSQMTHGRVRGCHFTCQSSQANKVHILVDGTDALRYESIFEDCTFTAAINATNSAVTLTNAVASATGLVEGNILFVRPSTSTTNFCAGTTDNIKIVAPAASNNASEGVTPA
jgi:hypothetical protein